MFLSTRVWFVLAAGLVLSLATQGRAAPANALQPNDEFVVAENDTPLMRGHHTVAALPRGQSLRVLKTEGSWIGTVATVDGRKVGGWVWAGQAVASQRFGATQYSTRRTYSLAPTARYGIFGGYSSTPVYRGTYGVLPNQENPGRLIMGYTPYGPQYWRADRKSMGY